MAFDYAPISADAKELIEEFGRAVTFQKKSRTAADTAKPWRGPAIADVESIEDIITAIVYGSNEDEPNSVVRRPPVATAYVAHLSFPTGTVVEDLDSIVDADTTWRIAKCEPVNPGDTKVIYIMSLEG